MSNAMTVEVGTRLLVRFKDEQEYHERYATAMIAPGRWMKITRDGDHYSHDLKQDFAVVIVMRPYAQVPAAYRNKVLIMFKAKPSSAAMDKLVTEGEKLAAESRVTRRRVVGKRHVSWYDSTVATGDAPAVVDSQPDASPAAPVVNLVTVKDDEVWILAEPTSQVDVGGDVTDAMLHKGDIIPFIRGRPM